MQYKSKTSIFKCRHPLQRYSKGWSQYDIGRYSVMSLSKIGNLQSTVLQSKLKFFFPKCSK